MHPCSRRAGLSMHGARPPRLAAVDDDPVRSPRPGRVVNHDVPDPHAVAHLRPDAKFRRIDEKHVLNAQVRDVERVEDARGREPHALEISLRPPRHAAAVDRAAAGDGDVCEAVPAQQRAVAHARLVGGLQGMLLIGRRGPARQVAVCLRAVRRRIIGDK